MLGGPPRLILNTLAYEIFEATAVGGFFTFPKSSTSKLDDVVCAILIDHKAQLHKKVLKQQL